MKTNFMKVVDKQSGLYVLISVVIIYFIISCDFEEPHCQNELILLETNDSLPTITLDCIFGPFGEGDCVNLDSAFSEYRGEDSTMDMILFNFKTSTSKKYSAEYLCYGSGIFCGDRCIFNTLLNFKGNILAEDRPLQKISEISQIYPKSCEDSEEPPVPVIQWDRKAPLDSVNAVLLEIEKSHVQWVEDKCLKDFGKQICELSSKEEMEFLRDNRLVFLFREILPPPPPPPPRFDHNPVIPE